MRSYRVVVSCGGKYHSYHTAEAAWRGGVLEAFITNRRRNKGMGPPTSLVQHHPFPAYFRYAVKMLPGVRRLVPWSLWGDGLFDILAARGLPTAFDILHVFAAYGYRTGRRAKSLGARVALDTGGAHIHSQRDLTARAYAEAGLRLQPMNARWVEKQAAEAEEADVVFVPSRFAHQTYLEQGFAEDRLELVPYGVDLECFSPPDPSSERRGFLFVGNISLMKGAKYLLDAATSMKLPANMLTLVGRPAADALPYLRKASGHYTHIPQLAPLDVAKLMRSSICLVLPSVQDGYAMVVTEGLACGLPAIVSENVGARECIEHNVSGLVIPAFDSEALAEAMGRVLEEHGLAEQLSSGARQTRARSWDEYESDLLEAWDRLMGEGS